MAGAEAEPKDRRPGGRRAGRSHPPARTGVRVLRHQLRRADLPAVAEVRGLLRDQLHRWEVPELIDTAQLLTSELVTNALVHTDSGAELTATLTGEAQPLLRVEVHDRTGGRPRARVPDEQAGGGRGLLLVQALADAWGVRAQPVGKTVWFELSLDAY